MLYIPSLVYFLITLSICVQSLKIEEVKEIKVKSVLKMEEKEVPVKSKSPKVSRAVHTAVCEVIEKIGKKTDGKEGLLQLHNLLQEHPDIDVNRYLVDANDLLKNHIRNGLKDIDTSKTNQVAGRYLFEIRNCLQYLSFCVEKMDMTVVKEEACGDNERGPEYYFEQLQMWRRRWDETRLKYNMPPTWSSD